MLLNVDFDEYFIDEEGIAAVSMLSLQCSSVYSSEFDTEPAPLAERVLWVPQAD